MTQLTDFGKRVKIALIEKGMSQEELMYRIHENTGMFVDSSYLWKIMSGKRNPPQLVDAIGAILDLQKGEE